MDGQGQYRRPKMIRLYGWSVCSRQPHNPQKHQYYWLPYSEEGSLILSIIQKWDQRSTPILYCLWKKIC